MILSGGFFHFFFSWRTSLCDVSLFVLAESYPPMYSVFHVQCIPCCGARMLGGTAPGASIQYYQGVFVRLWLLFFLRKKCSQRRVSVWMDVNATVGLTGCQRYDRVCGIAGVAAGPDKKRLLLTHLLGYRMYVLYRIGACRVIESTCFTVLKPTRL